MDVCASRRARCMFPLSPMMNSSTIPSSLRTVFVSCLITGVVGCTLLCSAAAQTDCSDSDNPLDTDPPKTISPEQLIQRFTAEESKVRDLRAQYSFTQDLMVQTLSDNTVDGQFHQVTQVSYNDKGKRLDNVTFSEEPTLRDIRLTPDDMEDIREFMPWMLTKEEAPQYKLTYAGTQHVDDLDTYVFHVEPLKEEKNKRYFQGRVWVDNREFQVVKLCGKTVPDTIPKKKKQPIEIRPSFVSYRQFIDGIWLPAYARVDDTLRVGVQSVHVREIVKFINYKRASTPAHP
jgi:hypothetical protein